MFLKAVFPGKYIQGRGVLDQLPDWVNLLGKNGLILASRTARDKVLAPYPDDLAANTICVEPFGGECCESELTRLARIIAESR